MGHSVGISDSYYRPTEQELFEEYIKAIDSLTISQLHSLQKENSNIKQKLGDVEASRKEVERLRGELEPLLRLKETLIKEGLLKET